MTTGSKRLDSLIHQAFAAVSNLSAEDQEELQRESMIDWAYGNLTCTGRRPYITRELVAAQFDKRYKKRIDGE